MLRLLELRLGFNRLDLEGDTEIDSPSILTRVIKQSSTPLLRKKKERKTSSKKSALIVPLNGSGEPPQPRSKETKEELTKWFWKYCEDGDVIALLDILHRSEKDAKFLATARNEYGNSCVMYACWGLSHDPQLLRLLLDSGAEPDIINAEGSTPLHECCISGKIEMAQILLEYQSVQALIDHKDDLRRRRTPLVCAVGYGNTHIVRLLLEKGASSESSLPVQIGCRYRQYHAVLAMLEHNEGHAETVEELWPELCYDVKVVGLMRWKRRKIFVMCLSAMLKQKDAFEAQEQEDGDDEEDEEQKKPPHRVFFVHDINFNIASFL